MQHFSDVATFYEEGDIFLTFSQSYKIQVLNNQDI